MSKKDNLLKRFAYKHADQIPFVKSKLEERYFKRRSKIKSNPIDKTINPPKVSYHCLCS